MNIYIDFLEHMKASCDYNFNKIKNTGVQLHTCPRLSAIPFKTCLAFFLSFGLASQ